MLGSSSWIVVEFLVNSFSFDFRQLNFIILQMRGLLNWHRKMIKSENIQSGGATISQCWYRSDVAFVHGPRATRIGANIANVVRRSIEDMLVFRIV